MFYLFGSSPQLLRVLSHVPEVDYSYNIGLFLIEVNNLEILHNNGTTILTPTQKFWHKRIAFRHQF